jgi:hypothetical protein
MSIANFTNYIRAVAVMLINISLMNVNDLLRLFTLILTQFSKDSRAQPGFIDSSASFPSCQWSSGMCAKIPFSF